MKNHTEPTQDMKNERQRATFNVQELSEKLVGKEKLAKRWAEEGSDLRLVLLPLVPGPGSV